jgi:nicotinate-nucleotide adenylyltransferase
VQLAIFGGSFDPVHIGHEAIVNNALDTLDIDKLVVVPTYLNPFKNSFHLEPNLRYELLKKVFNNYKKVKICDYEIKQGKSVYSIETVKYLKNLYNASKIYLIIGADNFENLHKWYKIEELDLLTEFVIASRDGYVNKKLQGFKTLEVNIDISSSQLRNEIDLNFIPIQIKEDLKNLQKG